MEICIIEDFIKTFAKILSVFTMFDILKIKTYTNMNLLVEMSRDGSQMQWIILFHHTGSKTIKKNLDRYIQLTNV